MSISLEYRAEGSQSSSLRAFVNAQCGAALLSSWTTMNTLLRERPVPLDSMFRFEFGSMTGVHYLSAMKTLLMANTQGQSVMDWKLIHKKQRDEAMTYATRLLKVPPNSQSQPEVTRAAIQDALHELAITNTMVAGFGDFVTCYFLELFQPASMPCVPFIPGVDRGNRTASAAYRPAEQADLVLEDGDLRSILTGEWTSWRPFLPELLTEGISDDMREVPVNGAVVPVIQAPPSAWSPADRAKFNELMAHQGVVLLQADDLVLPEGEGWVEFVAGMLEVCDKLPTGLHGSPDAGNMCDLKANGTILINYPTQFSSIFMDNRFKEASDEIIPIYDICRSQLTIGDIVTTGIPKRHVAWLPSGTELRTLAERGGELAAKMYEWIYDGLLSDGIYNEVAVFPETLPSFHRAAFIRCEPMPFGICGMQHPPHRYHRKMSKMKVDGFELDAPDGYTATPADCRHCVEKNPDELLAVPKTLTSSSKKQKVHVSDRQGTHIDMKPVATTVEGHLRHVHGVHMLLGFTDGNHVDIVVNSYAHIAAAVSIGLLHDDAKKMYDREHKEKHLRMVRWLEKKGKPCVISRLAGGGVDEDALWRSVWEFLVVRFIRVLDIPKCERMRARLGSGMLAVFDNLTAHGGSACMSLKPEYRFHVYGQCDIAATMGTKVQDEAVEYPERKVMDLRTDRVLWPVARFVLLDMWSGFE